MKEMLLIVDRAWGNDMYMSMA